MAAAAAAWRRGRGYLIVAVVLWAAYVFAGRMTWLQMGAAIGASITLWTLSFALGFRAFARGVHANGLGTVLTVIVPALTAATLLLKLPVLPALFPPGAVYLAQTNPATVEWMIGPIAAGLAALVIARRSMRECERRLRAWYDANQGRQSLD